MALLWKMICNLGDSMSLRHPVLLAQLIYKCEMTHFSMDSCIDVVWLVDARDFVSCLQCVAVFCSVLSQVKSNIDVVWLVDACDIVSLSLSLKWASALVDARESFERGITRFWGPPCKHVWYVWGLPWKFVGNSRSRRRGSDHWNNNDCHNSQQVFTGVPIHIKHVCTGVPEKDVISIPISSVCGCPRVIRAKHNSLMHPTRFSIERCVTRDAHHIESWLHCTGV